MAHNIRQLCCYSPLEFKGVFLDGGPSGFHASDDHGHGPESMQINKTAEINRKLQEAEVSQEVADLTQDEMGSVFPALLNDPEELVRVIDAAKLLTDVKDNPIYFASVDGVYKEYLEAYREMLKEKKVSPAKLHSFSEKINSIKARIELTNILKDTDEKDMERHAHRHLVDKDGNRLPSDLKHFAPGSVVEFKPGSSRARQFLNLNHYAKYLPTGIHAVFVKAPGKEVKEAIMIDGQFNIDPNTKRKLSYRDPRYVSILDGYEIHIPTNGAKLETEEDVMGDQEEEMTEGQKERLLVAQESKEYKEWQESVNEDLFKRAKESLDNPRRPYKVPEEFNEWDSQRFEDFFSQIDKGTQVRAYLNTLNKYSRTEGPWTLLERIIKESGKEDSKHLTMRRIVRRAMAYRVTDEESRFSALRNDPEGNKEFLIAAQGLLEAMTTINVEEVQTFENPDTAGEAANTVEGNEKIRVTNVLKHLFDPTDLGPLVKPGMKGRLRGERKRRLSMDEQGNRTDQVDPDKLDLSVSGKAAYLYMYREVMSAEPKQREARLMAKARELIELGYVNKYLGSKDSIKNLQAKPEIVGNTMDAIKDKNSDIYELMRIGVAVELDQELQADQRKLEEMNNLNRLEVEQWTGYPVADQIMLFLNEYPEFAELPAEQKAEASRRVKNTYLASLGYAKNEYPGGEPDKAIGLGTSVDTKIVDEPVISLAGGAGLLNGELKIGGGVGVKQKVGRFKFKTGLGASTLGAGFEFGADVAVDKYKEWNLTAKIGAGINNGIGPIGYSLGVRRDLGGALERKTDRLIEKEVGSIEEATDEYEKYLVGQGVKSGEVRKRVKAMQKMAQEHFKNAGVDAMSSLQFMKFNIASFPFPPYVMPYLEIAFQTGTFYVMEQTMTPDEAKAVADAKLISQDLDPDAIKTIQVYEGNLQLTENGYRAMSEETQHTVSSANSERFRDLREQGLDFTVTPDGILLDLSNGVGTMAVYVDQSSGIVSQEGPPGKVLISADIAKRIHVNKLNSFEGSGANNMGSEIFFSDKKNMSPTLIRRTSDSHLQVNVDAVNGTISETYRVIDRSADEITFTDRKGNKETQTFGAEYTAEEEALMKSFEMGPDRFRREIEDRDRAQGSIRTTLDRLGRSKESQVSVDEKKDLDNVAQNMIASPTTRKTYKQLSVEMSHDEVAAHIKKHNPDIKWNPAKLTYTAQKLMEGAFAKMKETHSYEEQVDAIMDWNKKTLKNILIPEVADQARINELSKIVDKVMDFNQEMFDDHIKNGTPLPKEMVKEGWTLGVQSGTEGAIGMRESQWNGGDKAMLIPVPLDMRFLTAQGDGQIGLEEDQARLLIGALREHITPLETLNPAQMFDSYIGQQVLDNAGLIFNSEDALVMDYLLTAYAHSIETGTSFDINTVAGLDAREAYDKFVSVVEDIRNKGKFENNLVIIQRNSDQVHTYMGFVEDCHNLSFTTDETLDVLVKIHGMSEVIGAKHVIVGAGVKTAEDVRIAIELGASGVLVASGVVCSENPEAALRDLASGLI